MSYSERKYLMVDRDPSIDMTKKMIKMIAPLIFLANSLFYMRIVEVHVRFICIFILHENSKSTRTFYLYLFYVKILDENVKLRKLEIIHF